MMSFTTHLALTIVCALLGAAPVIVGRMTVPVPV